MYTKLLVPLDGSGLAEQALPYAQALAAKLGVPIELLRAFEPVPAEVEEAFTSAYTQVPAPSAVQAQTQQPPERYGQVFPPQHRTLDQIVESRALQVRDYLHAVEKSLRESGMTVSTQVSDLLPAGAIVEEAAGDNGTLIVMTTHGRSGLSRWRLGSVADSVLHLTDNPMLVVKAGESADAPATVSLRTIIVPLDGSRLAEQVLPHVVHLARALDLKVVPTWVTPTPTVVHDAYAGDWISSYESYEKEADAAAHRYLAKMKEQLGASGVADVQELVLHGNPAAAIADLAQEKSDNLVAMTTHGRSGIGRWVLGSVADRIVKSAAAPVLLVRAR